MTEELPEHRFIYAGKRVTTKGALVHAWLPEEASPDNDEVRIFTKAKGTVVGGIYTIRSDDSHYMAGSVSYTGDRADEDTVRLLESRHRAESTRHAQAALEKNHARQSEISELCKPLRELVRKQIGWSNRAALIASITAEISG